jgi:hypothetical protein
MEATQKKSVVDMACGRLTPDESLHMLEEVERNPETSAAFETAVDLVNLSSEGEENIFRDADDGGKSLWRAMTWWVMDRCEIHPVLYPVGGLFLLLMSCFVIMAANSVWMGRYEELTGIDRTVFEWNVRGPGDGEVAIAYHFFTTGDYEQSLAHLERYMRSRPDERGEGFAEYTAGVVCLLSARKTMFGLFPTYSSSMVSRGLDHLKLAADRSTNPRLVEESHFLRAKGFLMLGQKEAALVEFDAVKALGLIRSEEASQIVARLQVLGQ